MKQLKFSQLEDSDIFLSHGEMFVKIYPVYLTTDKSIPPYIVNAVGLDGHFRGAHVFLQKDYDVFLIEQPINKRIFIRKKEFPKRSWLQKLTTDIVLQVKELLEPLF